MSAHLPCKRIKHVSRLRVVPRTEQSVGVVARVDIPKYLKNKSPIFPSQFYPEFIRLVSAASLLIRLVGYPIISSCEFFPNLLTYTYLFSAFKLIFEIIHS